MPRRAAPRLPAPFADCACACGAQFLFKRYLQFEVEQGDEAGAQHVRQLVAAFVEAHGGAA